MTPKRGRTFMGGDLRIASRIVAVPPASNPEQATPKAAAAMLLPSGTPARQIALGPLTPMEDAQTKAAAARRTEKPGVPLQIGIARSVGADDSVIRLADLPWRSVQGSGSAARIELTSTGASALRLGIVLRNAPGGLTFRFAGAGAPSNVFGPFAARDFPTAFPYWSPVVDGERAIVELELPPGVSPGDGVLELPTISHLSANAAQLTAAPDPFKAIGSSGSCEVDVACTADPPAALLSAASSVV